MAKSDFVHDWTKKLGFRDNPYQVKLLRPVDEFFAGYGEEKKKLNLFILEKYGFGSIAGESGSGKTTLLKWMTEQLEKNKVKVAFINAAKLRRERDLIEGIALPLLNIYEKNVNKTHEKLRLEEMGKFLHSKLKNKNFLVIILDNVGGLPKRYVSLFKYFFENHLNVQLIASGTKHEIVGSGIASIAEKDWLKINLNGLPYESAKKIIEKRCKHYGGEGIFPFEDKILRKVYEKSDNNLKKFLLLCRERVIKLSLDKAYMKEQIEKLQELKAQRMEEEQAAEPESKMISIKLGKGSKENDDYPIFKKGKFQPFKKKAKDPLHTMPAPDLDEQHEMLAEIVGDKSVKKEKLVEQFDLNELSEVLKEENKEEKKQEETEKKSKPKKKIPNADSKQTEELLSQLAKEFEEN